MLKVHDIQRFCLDDGPGMRTVIFLQGCPLHCPWCHNPDSQPFASRVSVAAERCIGCGRCQTVEPSVSCRRRPDAACVGCGICVNECPGGALRLLGRQMEARELLAEVLKDQEFYVATGGGVTLSGGEPLAQGDATLALLEELHHNGICTAVETSGAIAPQEFAKFTHGAVDSWLYDLKTTPDNYMALVGANAEYVLENLRTLSANGAAIRLRVPLIPGGNMDDAFATFVGECSHWPGVEGVDVLPYHTLGCGKASAAGLPEADWARFRVPTADEIAHFKTLCE